MGSSYVVLHGAPFAYAVALDVPAFCARSSDGFSAYGWLICRSGSTTSSSPPNPWARGPLPLSDFAHDAVTHSRVFWVGIAGSCGRFLFHFMTPPNCSVVAALSCIPASRAEAPLFPCLPVVVGPSDPTVPVRPRWRFAVVSIFTSL